MAEDLTDTQKGKTMLQSWRKIQNIKIEKKIIIMFLAIAAAGMLFSAMMMGYFLDRTKEKTYGQISHALQTIMQEKHASLETVAYTNMLSIASNRELSEALKAGDRVAAIEILSRIKRNLEQNTRFSTFKVHLHTKKRGMPFYVAGNRRNMATI